MVNEEGDGIDGAPCPVNRDLLEEELS